jgi:tight adherence protein B
MSLSGLFLIAFVARLLRKPDQQKHGLARARLKSLADRLGDQKSAPRELSILRQSSDRVLGVEESGMKWLGARTFEKLELLLYRADFDAGLSRVLVLSASLGGLFLAVSVRVFLDWGIGIGLGLLGSLLPTLVLWNRARRRIKTFEASFPEALALVGRSLRGGHALQRSLRIVSDEMEGPVASEFALVADELSLGRDMREVLDALSHRIGLADIDLFASGVLLQREYGGNLAEVVDKLAKMIRERFKFQSKVLAMTSTNRNSALILLVIPFVFVVMMYFTNRDFIRPLWETSEGHIIASVAAALALSGYGMARRVAQVKA